MLFNWIDWVIIGVFLYEAYQGWLIGFVSLGVNYVAFALSLWLAVVYHQPVSDFFVEKFGLAMIWGAIFGYFFIVFVAQMILMYVLREVVKKIPKKIAESKINSVFGVVVSILNYITLVAFTLLILTSLPLRGTIKKDVRDSKIGGYLVRLVEKYGGPLNVSLQNFQQKATKFFTIEPDSKESIALDVAPKSSDLMVDTAAELDMLDLVNAERAKVGAPKLVMDDRIVSVARAHSRDMFIRRYFAHVTPDGKDPAERLTDAGAKYSLMGENLAYAPDLKTAHQGLMESPEHKKNILDPAFHRIGIGIITTDSYGVMYTQDFAN